MSTEPLLVRAEFLGSPRRLGLLVIGMRLRTLKNSLLLTRRRHPMRAAVTYGVLAPAGILFTLLLTLAIASGLGSMQSDEAATAVLAALVTVSLIGSFVGASTAALQALYLSDDVPFLLTLPVPLRVLFAGKFADAAIGALPASILLIAALAAFGFARAGNSVYLVVAPIVAIGMITAATAIAIATVSMVTRFVPPKRARLYLLGVAFCLIGVSVTAWRFASPGGGAFGSAAEEARYISLHRQLAWIPTGWAAEGLLKIDRGEPGQGLILVLLTLAFTIALIGIAFEVFARTFVQGLARTRSIQPASTTGRWSTVVGAVSRTLPFGVGPLVAKEWLSLFRDLRRLSGAIWPVGIVIVYTVLLGRQEPAASSSAELQFWSANATLALLPWGLSLGISLYAFGSEGKAIQLLRSMPLSATRIFWAKVIASFVPVVLFATLFIALGLVIRGATLIQVVEMALLIAWMSAGYVIIDTAASAMAPVPDAVNIQRSIALGGRAFSIVIGGIFSLFTAAAMMRIVLWLGEPPASVDELLAWQIGGIHPFGLPLVVGSIAFAGGMLFFSTRLAIRKTDRLLQEGV